METNPNLKMTKQRRVILEEINRVPKHKSAYEIYEQARRRLPRVSLGTIYRNLEILSDHGLIRKLEISGGQRRYDGDTNVHSHVRCVKCGRLDDLTVEPVIRFDEARSHAGGYQIVGHRVELQGICPECLKR